MAEEEPQSPAGPPEGAAEDGCLGCMQRMRDQWAQRQADMFGALGACIARCPWVFGIITPLFWIGLGIGIVRAELQTDVDKLWVNFGSRTESDLDHYDYWYGGLSRPHLMAFTDKNGGDDVLTTEHIQEIQQVDAAHVDYSPWYNSGGTCAGRTQSTCLPTALCLWVASAGTSGQCWDWDSAGVKPTAMLKPGAITYTHPKWPNVKWGIREVCRERELGGTLANQGRAPCSTQAWPMDCFSEAPVSLNAGIICYYNGQNTPGACPNPAGPWLSNHPISFTNLTHRGFALAGPCALWSGSSVPKGYIMGGVTTDDSAGIPRVTKVRGFRAVHQLVNEKNMVNKYAYLMQHPLSGPIFRAAGYPESITIDEAEEILEGWEEAAHIQLSTMRPQMTHIQINYLNIWGTTKVVDDASNRNSYLVVVGFALLGVVVWVYLFRCDKVYSRLGLGVAGILCIAIAVFGTFGFAALCNIEFNGLTMQVLPYVTMGLGIDDMFVVVHYFHPPKASDDIEKRMRHCYGHAGPSVLATSLVNLTVFCCSIIVPVGAVRSFSYQAAIAVVVNFTMIFFGFGAYMAIDAGRIAARRMDCICCVEVEPDNTEPDAAPSGGQHEESEGGPDESAAKVIRSIANVLVGTLTGRIIILVVCLAAVGVAAGLGCTNLELGLPLSQFVEEGSPEQDYLSVRQSLLPHGSEGAVVVGGKRTGVDWSAADVQEKLNILFSFTMNHPQNYWATQMAATGNAGRSVWAEPLYLVAGAQWSLNFRRFAMQIATPLLGVAAATSTTAMIPVKKLSAGVLVNPSGVAGDCACTTSTCKESFFYPGNCVVEPSIYYELLGVWCGQTSCKPTSVWCNGLLGASSAINASGSVYCDDLILKTEWQGSTRVCTGIEFHQTVVINMPSDVSDAEGSVDVMDEARRLVDEVDLGLYPIGRIYLYNEQYRFTRYNLRLVLIVALCVVTAILALLFQSIILALCQSVVIGCSITVIIAFVEALDLRLNAVTLLSIVFGVSINVELCVHIARAFDTSHHKKRSKRAAYALGEMGAPVLCGAFTTFLSVLVLAFSDTQFFRDYFFKFYSCMVMVSLVFAWTLLPALLSLFGPPPLSVFAMDQEDGGKDAPSVHDEDHQITEPAG
eukprot:TRINITY_DN7658_c0_g2_i2.p1 TRINITY_DN7658_c0_g2~~TRINITY_DN7658_c0_g2_i2.p1  ORF type:complete len:1128 (+),score=326.72 TRINITY_DN7658_c0_g2_i2:103-3486(+)